MSINCDVYDLTSKDCVPIVSVAVATFASVATKDAVAPPFRKAPPCGPVKTAVGGVLSTLKVTAASFVFPAKSTAVSVSVCDPSARAFVSRL